MEKIHVIRDLTDTQKKIIRKLKAGKPIIHTKLKVVGRDPVESYTCVDGTKFQKRTITTMLDLGIISRTDIERKEGFGFMKYTCGFKLSLGY